MKIVMTVLVAIGLISFMVQHFSVKTIGQEEEAKVLNLSVASEPVMDPAFVTDSYSMPMLKNILEGLTRPTSTGDIVPAMAESWDISEDGRTYTFYLREGIQWSNGDLVTASDFEYAWKRVLNPETIAPNASKLFVIEGAEAYFMGEGTAEDVQITVVDDATLEVTLIEPTPHFLELTARQVTLYPVHQATVEADAAWAGEADETFVSNGPFLFTEWNHSGDYRIEKNPDYWDVENVDLDEVYVRIIEDAATANMNFMSGELDFIGIPFNTIPTDAIDAYRKDDELIVTDIGATYLYKLNTTDKVLQNKNIRKALSFAIDRQKLIDNIAKGEQTPAKGAIAPTVPSFEEDRDYFEDADYETARELLAVGMEELGYDDASKIPLVIQTNANDAHMAVAQFIQNEWASELGLKPTIATVEINVHFDSMTQLNFQIGRIGPTVDYNSAFAYLEQYYTADTAGNRTGWENADFQAILDKVTTVTDPDERYELYLEAEAILMDEMPFIPIYYYTNPQVVSDHIEGLVVDGMVDVQLKEVKYKQN
ncbi:peptide ABC transporter substrate-binding protein [Aerococcaceae bacterium WS4759]|uniref:Peptide ABC transporter substrate-binding protein n=2 Tax=Fundicoccus ignavus TaxID=2664442 RepID=A0A6I2GXG5_9LACT|nr:peptide ABC transporter substrate-binding protein [Fundicoccus ignavus]